MSNPTLLSPPVGGDQDLGPQFLSLIWVEGCIATVIVAMRFYARYVYAKRIAWDDWMILITLILCYTYSIIWTVYVMHSGCRHFFYLTTDDQIEAARMNWISMPFAIAAMGTGKISVALFLLRISGPLPKERMALYFIMISTAAICSTYILVTLIQCSPIPKLWDPSRDGSCWSPNVQSSLAITFSAYLAFEDFLLAASPIYIIWDLQLSLQKKIKVAVLLGLGAFSGVCAIIKTTKIHELTYRSDITWGTISLLIWTGNDNFTVILAACIPTIRPLVLDLVSKLGMEVNVSSWGRKGSTSPYASEENLKRRRTCSDLRMKEPWDRGIPGSSEDPWDSSFHAETDEGRNRTAPRPRTLEIRQTREWSVFDSPMPEPLSARRRNSQIPDWDNMA